MEKDYQNNTFAFLSPRVAIRNEHLSKKDVKHIKILLGDKIGFACLLASIAVFIFCIAIFVILGINAGFTKIVDTYSIFGVVALIVSVSSAIVCGVVETISLKTKNEKKRRILCHLGSTILFIGIATQMILSIHADAIMGFLSHAESVSASIILISILMLIQPVFWSEAIVLDLAVAGSVVFTAIHSAIEHGTKAIHYYILISIAYLFASYLVSSILFYAETQRYCQILRNERLYNTAIYDELTQCKNRFALREFLKENQKRWETRSCNLLIIMFDIDNFKEYNDQFSHPGGDFCLRSVADSVRREFKSPDLDFFRYGGEEFLLFMELRSIKDAKKIIVQVKNAVKGLKIEAPDGAPKEVVTISVGGLTLVTPINFNFDEHLRVVDKYLYKAKGAGKDTCCLDDKIVK